MPESSIKSFGFNYEHNGRKFAVTIVAPDADEAQARLASIGGAVLAGEMLEAISSESEALA